MTAFEERSLLRLGFIFVTLAVLLTAVALSLYSKKLEKNGSGYYLSFGMKSRNDFCAKPNLPQPTLLRETVTESDQNIGTSMQVSRQATFSDKGNERWKWTLL